MSQPSCPTCATLLRFFPESAIWGCDRCRVAVSVPSPVATALVPRTSRKVPIAIVVAVASVGIAIAAWRILREPSWAEVAPPLVPPHLQPRDSMAPVAPAPTKLAGTVLQSGGLTMTVATGWRENPEQKVPPGMIVVMRVDTAMPRFFDATLLIGVVRADGSAAKIRAGQCEAVLGAGAIATTTSRGVACVASKIDPDPAGETSDTEVRIALPDDTILNLNCAGPTAKPPDPDCIAMLDTLVLE